MIALTKTQENFLLGAFIGGACAATIALFLTPFSGKEARKQLLDRFQKLKGETHLKKKALTQSAHAHPRAKAGARKTSARPSQSVSSAKAREDKKPKEH